MKRVACGVLLVSMAGSVAAQTVEKIGAGAAVRTVDRFADFSRLASNGVALSDYTESKLFIGTDGDSWVGEGSPVFDPFHGADGADRAFYFPFGGSYGWTEIRTTDHKPIYAVEFMYGNGWTTGDIYGQYPWGDADGQVEWETWRNGVPVSSGNFAYTWYLQMGTIIGWRDDAGFDTLYVKCSHPNSYDPLLQALALDNLAVQITPFPPRCPADFNDDGFVNGDDYDGFASAFDVADPLADFNADGFVNGDDYDAFASAFDAGC
ncbi:MAG: hypothetical protein U0638_09830 [Phycisphaerales bacterium]